MENIEPKTEKSAQESIVIFNGMRPFYFCRPKYSLSGRKQLPFLTLWCNNIHRKIVAINNNVQNKVKDIYHQHRLTWRHNFQ